MLNYDVLFIFSFVIKFGMLWRSNYGRIHYNYQNFIHKKLFMIIKLKGEKTNL